MSIFNRRTLLTGATAGVGSAIVGASLAPSVGHAAPPRLEAAPPNPTRVLTLSAADFTVITWTADNSGLRYFQESDGLLRGNAANFLPFHCPLRLPVGATVTRVTWHVKAISAYDFELVRLRPGSQQVAVIDTAQNSGSPTPQAVVLAQSHTIEPNAAYVLRTSGLYGADGFYGAVVEYTLPPEGFVPLTAVSRDFNTRDSGQPKLLPSEERIVRLNVPGTNRAAVFNLTLTETTGGGGFVACFPADRVWPLNSSINWTGADISIANLVMCATDADSNIRIRGGANATHVIVDTIGYIA